MGTSEPFQIRDTYIRVDTMVGCVQALRRGRRTA